MDAQLALIESVERAFLRWWPDAIFQRGRDNASITVLLREEWNCEPHQGWEERAGQFIGGVLDEADRLNVPVTYLSTTMNRRVFLLSAILNLRPPNRADAPPMRAAAARAAGTIAQDPPARPLRAGRSGAGVGTELRESALHGEKYES